MGISVLAAASQAGIELYTVPIVGIELSQTVVTAIGILMILFLLVGSGFFSSSEIAMFSLPPHQVDAMVEQGRRGANAVKSLKDDPHRLLVTILVGNNMVNITMSSISTTIVGFYLDAGTAVIVSSLGITSMVLLFGESAPKSYAVENTELHARRVAPPLKVVGKVLLPLIAVFDQLTRQVNKITGGRSEIESTYVTRDEIRNMIKTGEREGVLDEEEREMLHRTLRFNNTIAKEVMTPRLDVTAVSKDADIAEAIETCIQSGHARLPVYEGSLDNVIGVVHIRDLVRDLNYGENEQLELPDLIEPTLHVPESKNVDDLLKEMRENRMHMVVVIDEFGTTEGIVTMEDLTEEIVGEILEGSEEEPIEFVDSDTAIVKGEVNIEEVNEALSIDIPEGEEFETLAGFIFNRVGRLVEEGEIIAYDGVEIRVEQVENTRIMKARISRIDEAEIEGDLDSDEDRDETADDDKSEETASDGESSADTERSDD
ncbi:hemolysin family protein [Halapricum desulfuricans]|uniref:Hemolysins or related protein containing CBS domains n=1 Tax=Halapricum desulfuricans TaxID=2841257 RepID=A0A897MVD6_9EURY|nr:hemolysin family protein [Halapricum desulfuricans]QSG04474.1 Hemolysins or related protein containing CBS domains [Halapricum desulfuricans]